MIFAIRNVCILVLMLASPVILANSYHTVETLIRQHINAVGGEKALMEMQSISRHGNIYFFTPNGKDKHCYHTDIIYPTYLREQIKSDEIIYDRGTDGETFWLWTGSLYEIANDQALIDYMTQAANHANRDMLQVLEKSENFEIMKKVPFWAPKNSQCIQEIVPEDGIKKTYCFDVKSGLENALGSIQKYRWVSDWRQVGGIKIPFYLADYEVGEPRMEIQLEWAEYDPVISEQNFVKPDSPQLYCGSVE